MRIDFHSHILPGIDDGSKDLSQSAEMLKELKKQGVDTVVATPHFYVNQNNVDTFIRRRNESYDLLIKELSGTDGVPAVVLGAEVMFYNDIQSLENIEKLCIGDTGYIMIEMPHTQWNDAVFDRLFKLTVNRGIKLIIAHIDRYINKHNNKYMTELAQLKAILQINAAAFTGSFFEKKRAVSLIKNKTVQLIGSDCHNMTSRRPRIDEAYNLIEKKLGTAAVLHLEHFAERILYK